MRRQRKGEQTEVDRGTGQIVTGIKKRTEDDTLAETSKDDDDDDDDDD
jgi:hypothetical protein